MIGKTIKTILTTNSALIALVPAVKIFPYVMNEDTTLPAIVYTIDSLTPDYSKGGWANDAVFFSVHSFAKDYTSLQGIVSAVRTALELNETGTSPQEISRIALNSFEEGYEQSADVFYNKLTFSVTVKNY